MSNKEKLDTGTPTGKLMVTMIAAINEFERQNLLDRQREGIEIAKREGKYTGGHRKSIDLNRFVLLKKQYDNREINKVQFAKMLKVSRPTLDRILREKDIHDHADKVHRDSDIEVM